MSELEASAQSRTAGESATATAPENRQDEPKTGSDIADIDEYQRLMKEMSSAPVPTPPSDAPQSETVEELSEEDIQAAASPDAEGEDATKVETPPTEEPPKGEEPPKNPDDEAQRKLPPQFRFRPTDPIETRALELRKNNPDLTLEECLDRAKRELRPEGDASAEANASEPKTSADAEAALEDLWKQHEKALADDLDFKKVSSIQRDISKMERLVNRLQRQEEESSRQAQQADETKWNEELTASKAKAVEVYPATADPNSALIKRMREIDSALKENGDDLYYSPNKPLKLAQMAAADLGIAPRAAQKQATSKPVVANRPAQVQPASGHARTTQATHRNGTLAAGLDNVRDEDSYRMALKGLGQPATRT